MEKKVFISHATADCELIDVFTEFLSSIGIKNNDIFCTSIRGTLESGKNFVEKIKENVQDYKVVIFLLSEQFFSSYFCLAELGAAWVLNQNILPIIIPPISIKEFNSTPLIGIHALNMGHDNFARELYSNLVKKNVIENDNLIEKKRIFSEFNIKFENTLKLMQGKLLKYETTFSRYVLDYIKNSNILNNFFNRIMYECEAIQKVVETITNQQVFELEEIVNALMKTNDIDSIAQLDTNFHKKLFEIAGESELLGLWRVQFEDLFCFIRRTWASINSEAFREQKNTHHEIFLSIRNKDLDMAVRTMQKHFATIPFHLLCTYVLNDCTD